MDLRRRLVTEALGCGLVVVALEGSHHVAEHLGASATEGRLFMSLSCGAVLACLLWVLRPLSGAHLNPALTFADALGDHTPWREVPLYALAQLSGSLVGRLVAHRMCNEPLLLTAKLPVADGARFLTEMVATFGLLVVVRGCVRTRPSATPLAIAGYVAATVWFTDSRSLANPALVLARAASAHVGVMSPWEVESFVAAQLLGAALAVFLFRWLLGGAPRPEPQAVETVVFECAEAGPAHLAAALFNSLAHPERARAVVSPPPARDDMGPPGAVDALMEEAHLRAAPTRDRGVPASHYVLIEVAGQAPGMDARVRERWSLPALSLKDEAGAKALQAALRPKVHQLLARQGWERLHVVSGAAPEGPRALT
ncbi:MULTISPECIES: aquaporin [Corallococcus]|uniref:aquaporin n=1 Tax=Corallococcus TaxID=83461 RepID=UPI00117E1412|nr:MULTISPECIES: aquaporin [Corallococcus]NBD12630.1 aquaporin family protein [Corallococcus silvisoli]TSC29563.1 aquaporin family protein [Corallococcus sp. Z5C101001]